MDIKRCRELLEKTLEPNIVNSNVIAEILFSPSFARLGRTVYCQLRCKDGKFMICYEHFNYYEFVLMTDNKNPYKLTPDIFTDNFCGIAAVSGETQIKLEGLLRGINALEKKKIETAFGLDGFSHTVIINDFEYYWWCEPVSKEAKLLNEFVSAVFSFLPREFRQID